MAIHIYNRTTLHAFKPEDDYELVIDNKRICLFQHKRGEGLAECLRRAAEAVERKDDEDNS